MWIKKLSIHKPQEREVIGDKVYKRRFIQNIYSSEERTSYWSYEEEVEEKSLKAEEIKQKILELKEDLKRLGVEDDSRDETN